MKQYKVTKKFINGILKGLTYTEITSVKFEIGYKPKKPYFGSPYVIIKCLEV